MSKWRHLKHEIEEVEEELYNESHIEGQHELLNAIQGARLGKVRKLLDQSVDPNFLNNSGLTPLHVAANQMLCQDSLEVLTLLAYFGCPVERRDVRGQVALHVASQKCVEFVQVLLDAGTPVNVTDKSNCTPLMLAVHQSSPQTVEIVELLLNRGADVHLQDINGKNALHHACEVNGVIQDVGKRNDIVYMLLRAGLSIYVTDCSDRTAFNYELTDVLSIDSSHFSPHHLSVLQTFIRGGSSLDSTCRKVFAQILNTSPTLMDRCVHIFHMLEAVSSVSQLQQFLSVKSNTLTSSTFERFAIQLKPSLQTVPSLRQICRSVVRAALQGQVLFRTQLLDLPLEVEHYVMCR